MKTSIRILYALIAILIVAGLPAVAQIAVPVTWTTQYQAIDGFGAAGSYPADSLMAYPEPTRSNILDLLFSPTTGAGLSILRSEIGAGAGDPPTSNTASIEPSQGVWSFAGDGGQRWLMQQATSRGVGKLFGTVWSPPAWMKTNGDVRNGGSLRTDMYQAYADYLATYALQYQARFGLRIHAVSLANEQDAATPYQSCQWTGPQFRDFIKNNLKPTFATNGVQAKVIVGEPSFWSESYAMDTLADPLAAPRLDITGAHGYNFPAYYDSFTQSKAAGKQVWMTETSTTLANDPTITDGLRWAVDAHKALTQGQANAYLYWLCAHDATDGEGLVQLTANNTYSASKRLYTLGNFSRFVRPGYVRMDTNGNPAANVYVSAFKDPAANGFVLVAINNNTASQAISLQPSGFTAGSVTPYTTSSTQNWAQGTAISLVNGAFAATLPAQSITTFVGSGTAAGTAVLIDPLNDFTKVYSKSANWFLDTSSPDARMEYDTSRAARTSDTDENLKYSTPNMTWMTLKLYYWNNQGNNLKIWASRTDGGYTLLTAIQDTPVVTGSGWTRVNYSVSALPANTNFLMIEAPPTGNSWNPQISDVRIGYTTSGYVTITDALSDFTKVYSKTAQWTIDTSSPDARMEYDAGRATRTSDTLQNIKYNKTNMAAVNVKVYYYNGVGNNIKISASATNGNYTLLSPLQDAPVATSNGWTRVNYSVPALPAGTNFLMIEAPPTGTSWNPQIGEVRITSRPAPAAPTNLTTTAGNSQVALSWPASSGATSYNVKRSTQSGGPYVTVATTSSTSYTNASLANGTAYYYVVTAVSASGEGPASTQATATANPKNTHSGTWAAKATVTATPTWSNVSQFPIVTANTSYAASLWIKGSGTVVFRVFGGVYGTELGRVTCNATSSWQQFTLNVNSGANTQLSYNITDGGGVAGSCYIDDCLLCANGGANILANPGCESGNTGWSIDAGAPFNIAQNP